MPNLESSKFLVGSKPHARRAVLAVVGFLVMAGCSTSNSSSSSSSGGAGGAETCDSYFDALNVGLMKCGGNGDLGGGDPHAKDRFRTLCTRGLAAPGTGVDTNYLDMCAAALRSSTSCAVLMGACKAKTGTLPDGSGCANDVQCKSGRCSSGITITGGGGSSGGAQAAVAICGKCVATIPEGGACDPSATSMPGSSTPQCAEGTTCLDKKCVSEQAGGAGMPCPTGTCVDGYYCVFSGSDPTASTCMARKPANAPCKSQSQLECADGLGCQNQACSSLPAEGKPCPSGACAKSLGCDLTTTMCKKVTFGKPGDACDDAVTFCTLGSCNQPITNMPMPGTCPRALADGTACNPDDRSATCDFFAECVDGKCTLPDPSTCK